MKKIYTSIAALLILAGGSLALPASVYAHCPLCVVGAASGITLTRLLGVDDSITGIWMGAFLGAVSVWTFNIIARKVSTEYPAFLKTVIYVFVFATTIWTFYKFGLVIEMEKMFGLHKLIFGMVVGGVAFYVMEIVNDFIKKSAGKSLFPYQRIVFSLGIILILSLADYILIGYYI